MTTSQQPEVLNRQTAERGELDANYRSWQRRILASSTFGYAIFYFVRKNLSMAMPEMERTLHLDKSELGLFLTLHGVLYGISKFINGFVGDRVNARFYMSLGLFLSALINIAFGYGTSAVYFGVLWLLNGWVQGMGFPPCARLLTHWFPPRKLATKMSLWNTSHSLGAAAIVILCGYLVRYDWRLCFWVPGGIALVTTLFLLIALRDTPESIGLPPIEAVDSDPTTPPESPRSFPSQAQGFSPGSSSLSPFPGTPGEGWGEGSTQHPSDLPRTDPTTEPRTFKQDLYDYVFSNKYIWIVSIANFFVYVVRYGMLDWGPTFLKESKGIQLTTGGWMVAAFELSGAAGAVFGGWITDRLFHGKGARACVFFMILCTLALVGIWMLPPGKPLLGTLVLCAAGFLIYGPQCLIGVIVAKLATKRAAASAVGLTGIFGYASTILSGVGVGYVAQHYGWNGAFLAFIATAIIGLFLFLLAWPAKAHG